jgi:hypothetical protein
MEKYQFDRRNFIRLSLLSAGYSLTAGSSLLAPIVQAVGRIPNKLGADESIFTLSGKIKVDGKDATQSTIITPNSTVETGSNSQLIFVVGKDAHILRENSKLVLTEGDSNIESGLQLAKGKILSVFGKRDESEKSLNIKTTTATIGIRGTGVYTEAHEDHSYVCTCYGTTHIASNSDSSSSEIVKTFHHDAPRYVLADGKQGKRIEAAPMKNHTDEELMLIEALVGRTPPFNSLRGYNKPRKGY